MTSMAENEFEQRLHSTQRIPLPHTDLSFERRLNEAVLIKEQLDRVRSWRGRLSPKMRRVYSSGQLLFQIVGAAGYAGYFASMHTLMRIVSGVLMASSWYAIYRIKGGTQP
jgi:hypothetical protein